MKRNKDILISDELIHCNILAQLICKQPLDILAISIPVTEKERFLEAVIPSSVL